MHEKAPQILAAYLTAIKTITPQDKEHTHRAALENLLNALKNELSTQPKATHTTQNAAANLPNSTQQTQIYEAKDLQKFTIIHEPNNDKSGLGAPDFQVKVPTGLTLGYIENKRVGANLQELIDAANKDEKSQIARYLKLSDNLILTDYLNFWRVRKDERGKILAQENEKVQICTLDELPQLANAAAQKIVNSKATQNAANSKPATAKTKPTNSATQALFSSPQEALNSAQEKLLKFFKNFFINSNPKPIATALEFANALASHTREVANAIIHLENEPKIATLYANFKDILYKELDFKDFADNFAQTLTYSLFLAKLNDESGDKIDLYNAQKFVPDAFPLIRAMSGFLRDLDNLKSRDLNDLERFKLHTIVWLVGEILSIINFIDIARLTKELNKMGEKDIFGDYQHKDPYLHFYETFLSQYNPDLREMRGVYYTPHAVVDFIIKAIDSTLKSDFGCENGLGNALEADSPITLLDFATGTGTFLLEAFRNALQSVAAPNSPHRKDQISRLVSRFSGFEFLIAPYTVAHLKISQCFKDDYNAVLNERLQIYLTNTIYTKGDSQEATMRGALGLFGGLDELAQEFLAAQKIKNSQILIITGNPPYSGASANKGLFEDEVKIAYGLEPSLANLSKDEHEKIALYFKAVYLGESKHLKDPRKFFEKTYQAKKLQNEKNPKWLLDDYVKFIRFAEAKIESQKQGIIAIISNNAFLDNPTFRGMRWHLLNSFDKIYILDLHGNSRKKELAPDGSKDDNVFDIMQGVCISVFVKTGQKNSQNSPNLQKGVKNLQNAHTPSLRESQSDSKQSTKTNASATAACFGDKSPRNDEFSEPLAQIFHYDLFGKRREKFSFLLSNTLNSVNFSELKPKPPFYLFVPQNDELRGVYEGFWSVKDIFAKSGVGICSKRDEVVFQATKERLKALLHDFATKPKEELRRIYSVGADSRDWKFDSAIEAVKENAGNLDEFIAQCHYRPFDFRYTYYINKSRAFMAYPVFDIFQHFLGCENVGLLVSRQESAMGDDTCNPNFVSDKIVDLNLYRRGGEQVMPLYLKTENSHNSQKGANSQRDEKIHSGEMKENLTPKFREFIDAKYGEKFSPEQILGYIYAILYHKAYREKFLDFLKIDFPKIPFVADKTQFLKLSELGSELVNLHLMKAVPKSQSVGEAAFERDMNGANIENYAIEKALYKANEKRIYVNESLHFSGVDEGVWGYKIGGYAVLDKYLKSHKGEQIDYAHFENIIKILHRALQIEAQIAEIELA